VNDDNSVTIGVPDVEDRFSGCLDPEDAIQLGKIVVADSYHSAMREFKRLILEYHCANITGGFYAHRVLWSGNTSEGIIKVVEMSLMDAPDHVDFSKTFYVITERAIHAPASKSGHPGQIRNLPDKQERQWAQHALRLAFKGAWRRYHALRVRDSVRFRELCSSI